MTRKRRKRRRGMKRLGNLAAVFLLLVLFTSASAGQQADGRACVRENRIRQRRTRGSITDRCKKSECSLTQKRGRPDIVSKRRRGGGEKIYPASLTKIMTVLTAIEQLPDLDEEILLPAELLNPLYAQGASMAGFQPGEQVKAEIFSLRSHASKRRGVLCGGGRKNSRNPEEEFAALMNKKAEKLGMKHTHFTNTTGLPDENHYSTAEDIACLLDNALKNNTFREIFTSSRYSTGGTNLHPEGITFYSTLSQSLEDPTFPGGVIEGGKTGYTQEAGLCLASLAEKDGREYIFVSAKGEGNHQTEPVHVEDALYAYKAIPASGEGTDLIPSFLQKILEMIQF